jgi:hypothetical protein
MTFGVSPAGLYMKILPLFRFHHPSLLIPWSDIREEKVPGIIFTYVELTFSSVPGIRLRIISSLAEDLLHRGRQQKRDIISPAYKKVEPH